MLACSLGWQGNSLVSMRCPIPSPWPGRQTQPHLTHTPSEDVSCATERRCRGAPTWHPAHARHALKTVAGHSRALPGLPGPAGAGRGAARAPHGVRTCFAGSRRAAGPRPAAAPAHSTHSAASVMGSHSSRRGTGNGRGLQYQIWVCSTHITDPPGPIVCSHVRRTPSSAHCISPKIQLKYYYC